MFDPATHSQWLWPRNPWVAAVFLDRETPGEGAEWQCDAGHDRIRARAQERPCLPRDRVAVVPERGVEQLGLDTEERVRRVDVPEQRERIQLILARSLA